MYDNRDEWWKDAHKSVSPEVMNKLAKVVCRQLAKVVYRQNACSRNASCAWCNDVAENVIGEYLILSGQYSGVIKAK